MADSLNINESLSQGAQPLGQSRGAANRPEVADQANENARAGGNGRGVGQGRAVGQSNRSVVVEISQEAIEAQAATEANAPRPTRQSLGQQINNAVANLQNPPAGGEEAGGVVAFPVGLNSAPGNPTGGNANGAASPGVGTTVQLGSLSDDDGPVRAASFSNSPLGGANGGIGGQNLISRLDDRQIIGNIGDSNNGIGGGNQLGGAGTPDFGPLARVQDGLTSPAGNIGSNNQIGGNDLLANNNSIGNDNNQIGANNDDADNDFGPLTRVQDRLTSPGGAGEDDDGAPAQLTRARPSDQIEISALRFNTQRPGGQSVAGIAQSPGQTAAGATDFRTNLAVPVEGEASNIRIGAEEPGPTNGIANDFSATGQLMPIIAEAVAEPAAGVGPGDAPEASIPRAADSAEVIPQPEASPQAEVQTVIDAIESENDRTPFNASDSGALAGNPDGGALSQAATPVDRAQAEGDERQVTEEDAAASAADLADDATAVNAPAATVADNIERNPTPEPALTPATQAAGEAVTPTPEESNADLETVAAPAEAERLVDNAEVTPNAEPAEPAETEAAVVEAPPAAAAPAPTEPGGLADEGTAAGDAAAETRTDTAFESQQTENRTAEPIEPRNPIDLFVR